MRWLFPLVVALALGAVACQSARYQFVLDATGTPPDQPLVWPQPPEAPRYTYLGQLLGERNFIKEQAPSPLRGALEWLTGVLFGEAAPRDLARPQSGAVDAQGRVYVTDVSRQALFVFDRAANQLAVWDMAEPFTRFVAPIGVAVNGAGEVFVADAELGLVARFDGQGRHLGVLGRGFLKRPTGLALDPERGELYVVDTHAHDIKVYNARGELARVIGRRGEDQEGLNFPIYAAYHNGKVYVTDSINARVQVFSAEGAYLGSFGKRGLYVGDFTRPKGIAADGAGRIYVVESYYDYMLVFDPQGEFLLPLGGSGAAPGKFYLPAGVWAGPENTIYVADMFNRRVAVFQYVGGAQ